jgi:murein DD-endopeptidase MepM/ murein hydrolase activator NlpD
MRCPVDGPTSFTDTFGEPRSGGRTHQGVDMFAATGTPVAAIVDGSVLRKTSSPAGGITLYYTGGDGYEYFYAHLSGYADVSPGQKMSAGDRLGFVGDTGNAGGGPPHLHFEARPNGGAPINPTSIARKACG